MFSLKKINNKISTLNYYLSFLGLDFKWRALYFYELILSKRYETFKIDPIYSIVELDIETIRKLDYPDKGWLTKEEAINQLYSGGKKLFAIIENKNRIICYQWIEFVTANIVFFDMNLPLKEKCCYSSHIYTVSERRNKGFAKILGRYIINYLKKKYNIVFLVIAPNNISSISLNEALGFKRIGKILYIKFIFLKLYIFRNKIYKSISKLFHFFNIS